MAYTLSDFDSDYGSLFFDMLSDPEESFLCSPSDEGCDPATSMGLSWSGNSPTEYDLRHTGAVAALGWLGGFPEW